MHLRTLTLRGFKSFASATTLHLEPGITCVVGPNGSGKSNVVDALAWVMGEQGAKTLRGGSMADVIFAGTAGRPPLGRAEVSLTIDNSDGALPIDYAEVTITRTLFRGGGSEYAINGTACRLLDVQELLSDSGIGREMHVIVGQGQLDAVLSASPEERRGFIEEAAGVLKHRKRKEKALRKLDGMAANLARLTDLTAEIRRQLGPLAKQADAARRAQVIQADLRDARARLLADDLVQLVATLEAEVADTTALRERIAGLEAEQGSARERLLELEAVAAAAAPDQARATETWFRLSGLRERLRGTHGQATERRRLLGTAEAEATPGRDPDELGAQAERARAAEAALGAEVAAAQETLAAAEQSRADAEARAQAAERGLAGVHRAVADRREGVARIAAQVATRRGRLEAAEAELRRLRRDREDATARLETAQRAFGALELEVAGQEEGEEGLDAAYESAVAAVEDATAEVAALEAQERAADGVRATEAARRDALALALTRGDGTDALLAAADRPAGLLGTVAEHLRVEPGTENAVAAVLGELAGAVVADSPEAAVDAMRAARTGGLGTVRIVVATAPPHTEASPTEAPGSAPAAGRWVVDLVEPVPALAGATARLLRDAVLVVDLAAARQAVAAADVVAVTPEGEVLSRTSASGGGGDGPSVLEVHAAHAAAGEAVEAATAELERLRFALRGARARLATAAEARTTALDALHASDAQLAGVAERLGQLASAVRTARAELDRAGPALERAEAAVVSTRAELGEWAERLEAAHATPETDAGAVEAATRERDGAAATATAARAAETEARLALRTLEERARSLAGRASALEQAARAERAARERAEQRARRRAEQAAVATAVAEVAARAIVVVEAALARAAAERERVEAERAERERETAQLRARLDEVGARLAELTDEVHQDEMARAEQRLRIEALELRALEELGLEPDVLVAELGPDRPVPGPLGPDGEPEADVPYVREQQERRLHAAERALARLGRVNPLALEEHAALAERHHFLTTQLADLRKSRADLLAIVGEIDERVERVFAAAFEDTAREFEDVFARLFPGGEGRLLLTDPEDMLTTGVEVEARPPGKKVKRLSLLSGGERSLTAVALLVAIFKARPSPFYVMDEVEAALDDVNLGRLLEIFTELRRDSQLVVVTHQKRTMEIADALYGVTMRGDGVTTVVSQRLREDRVARV